VTPFILQTGHNTSHATETRKDPPILSFKEQIVQNR